jgi:superfamily II RNA helicase
MLLPDHIGLIFLSATSPNREVFAEWVGRTKQKKGAWAVAACESTEGQP